MSPTRDFIAEETQAPFVIRPGDVVRLNPNSTQASILYRRGSRSNFLFITERCNSLCLMCSQPPRDDADDWRIPELHRLIELIDKTEEQVGFTGGEPTLLGEDLVGLIAACKDTLPNTGLHILSNGKRFSDSQFVARTQGLRHPQLTWAIPLYSDDPARHDYVVQSAGAFNQTVGGLLELGRWKANIEIRVVLSLQTIPRLPQLARFIYRNLPFVKHVALMGLEPMGYAKSNRDKLWLDPIDYVPALEESAFTLANNGMQVSIYNLPHCVLPQHLWTFARRSISDWKNNFLDECRMCAAQDQCAGFFASAGMEWRSSAIRAIPETKLSAAWGMA